MRVRVRDTPTLATSNFLVNFENFVSHDLSRLRADFTDQATTIAAPSATELTDGPNCPCR